MIGFTFLRVVIVYGSCMIYEHVSQSVLYRVRNYLYDKIQRQDMTFYSTYRTGDLMTRLTGDLDAVRHMVAWVIRMVIESFSLFAAAAIFFLYTNWKLALCILVISPFVFWIIYLFRNRVAPMHAALREKLAQMNTCAQENISGNRVVKAFAREEYEIEKFDRANTDYAETNKATAMVWLKFFPFVESIANLMPVVLLAVGGVFMIKGQLTMGDYVAFSGLIWAIANPMRQMGNIMNEFQRFSAASKKVMELYYSEAKIKDEENAVAHPERFEGKIEFDNVSFQYEDGDLPVLHNISFTVNPNETVAVTALVGVWLDKGVNTALDHAGLAVIVYLALVLTESLWRRFRQTSGIGMGDVKALFALCTFDPMGGIVAFTAALLGLAIACLITKSRSLPLLPFLVPIFAIIEVVGCTL